MPEPKSEVNEPYRSVAACSNVVEDALFYRLFAQAERVRWRVADVPWDDLDASSVSAYWRELVLDVARSELTTFDGTRQFMERFGHNADFSQWLAIWFYEETKHPQVLMMWLERVGVGVDSDFLIEGRKSPRFATSWLGTLTLNVIAEVMAADAYGTLARHAPEPVLRHLAQRIAADEARHAAHFFVYGERLLLRCADPDRERKNALEVLYLWLNAQTRLDHPIGQILDSVQSTPTFREGVRPDGFVTDPLRERICAIIGAMIGIPLRSRADVLGAMRQLLRRRREV